MKRPRINIICSSSNYEESAKKYKKLRTNYLQSIHNNNLELIEEIKSKIETETKKLHPNWFTVITVDRDFNRNSN